MRTAWAWAVAGVALVAGRALPVELEQIISRENPSFRCDAARLAVGRDGKVYVCSSGNSSFALRLDRDGSGKVGGAVEYAAQNATANGDGILATANGHFAHKVTVYGPDFARRGAVDEFLVNDQVGWDAPAHVEAGEGGDFYAIDQHRDRILKISATGKLVKAYPVARKPAGGPGLMQEVRVHESRQAFYILRRGGPLRCVGFDGVERWTFAAGVTWGSPNAGGFDVDDGGNLYAIDRHGEAVQKVSPEGKLVGQIKLQAGKFRPAPGEHGWTDLRVHGGDLLLKRRHPTELFQRYDLATGAFRQAVSIDHERLAASFPERVWVAGKEIPFDIQLSGNKGEAAPRWRVWARPLGNLDYRELALAGGKLQVPVDCAGVYQIKVTPEVRPWQRGAPSAYGVRTWVDIRQGGAKGSAAVWAERHRDHFGRGEEIRCLVQVRGKDLKETVPLALRLTDGGRVVAEKHLAIPAGANPQPLTLSAALTAALRPGRYLLTASAPGLTCVPLPLVIGPGVGKRPFHLVQYGDYGPMYPAADVWGAPDATAAHVARTAKIGMNLIVDRIGDPNQLGALNPDPRSHAELQEVLKHLEADPDAPAPGRYAAAPALLQTLSGYSAAGIEQMAILMMNDAGLPLGEAGFDPRKPPQLLEAITKVTDTLKPYPSFRGWSWSSNWWTFEQRGANAATTPQEKAAYEAALKRAKETGAWDPVLEKVSSRRLSFAVEAQALFNKKLREIAPGLVTASACPHRNVESYPPATLSNVDEVDLQAQWEQVAVPYHTPHGVDFYRRPGKRAWAHPEVWNDSGTGDQILPALFQAVMRGADGVGCSGPIPAWNHTGRLPDDPRIGHFGAASVFRALNDTLRLYGPWLATLENDDRVAIVVSGRMLRIDDWPGVMGTHFARLFEAYMACLHAHRPASYVFVEDLKPDTLQHYKAVLVVGQTVEMEPELLLALKAAKAAGVAVSHDGTCRPSLVKGFTSLGVAFNTFEKDRHPASDDAAYLRFAAYCKAHVPALRRALAKVAPAAEVENPEVFLSERKSGGGRYLFVVNNTTPELEPGHLWRITLAVANRVPTVATVRLNGKPNAVYDVFAGARVEAKDGVIQADLRSLPARIYALLPKAIARVELKGPAEVRVGQKFVWAVQVHDDAGGPIAASVPVRVRLLGANGVVLDEQFMAAGLKGASGSMLAPLNAAGDLILEATELFSGQSSVLRLGVQQPSELADLTGTPGAAVAEAKSTGKSGDSRWSPAETRFGPHVRDMVLTENGSLAVLNTMNWDHNLYGLDVETGAVRWRQRAGHYFAFDPRPLANGAAVQGFDFESAEGYHLYLINPDGRLERRFALYGLPRRQIQKFVPGILTQHINHFAAAPGGRWVASAGDLGLAVWSRDGKPLWSRDWWKTDRHGATLAALGDDILLAVEGTKATALDVATGKESWQVALSKTGEVRRVRVSGDGKTAALLSTADGGRVFVLRGGKVIAALPTGGNDLAVSADGSRVAVVDANHLKMYSARGGLSWTLPGDDTLLNPRFSPDGQRIAAGSALGTAYVVGADGEMLLERDMRSLTVPAWLPDGDLLLATWMGAACRLDMQYAERWRVRLRPSRPDMRGKLLAWDGVPTTRITSWGNAEPEPSRLADNLLTPRTAVVKLQSNMPHFQFIHPAAALVDGKPEPPPSPWLSWSDVGLAAELSPVNSILIDTFRTRLRVTAVTLAEDPKHPESWLRDAAFEYWDVAAQKWVPVQPLLSNAAIHTHKFARPVEAARFRIVLPHGMSGNLRLGEIALHGEKLGSPHPDVIARRPVAVLFDESDDLKESLLGPRLRFRFEGAYAGGRCLALDKDGDVSPPFVPPFGHALPNWDFEIAEKPRAGQYRYLQFAWKATSPETKGLALQVGELRYGVQVAAHCGEYKPADGVKAKKVSEGVPREWQVARVDLWEVFRQPVRLQSLRLSCRGGGAAFDQIVLGRTEADLPGAAP